MILQTIILPFDAGAADTIYTKQGETGRGISFELPFTIDPEDMSDYKAEFIAVKPDDTFVIEDCSLVTHGADETLHTAAIITLPEQVSAAKGTGSYIIKIYDYVHDGDLIYSAAGGLYVDDHLLLDSLIESVAEVNGYNFPDDFLTQDDLKNIIDDTATRADRTWSSQKISGELSDLEDEIADVLAGLIDDNTTGADSTWSSQKISDELGNVDTGHNYSTTEHAVGTWIDGSTIYEKTVIVTAPNTNGFHSTAVSTPNFSKCISAELYNVTAGKPCYQYCPWYNVTEIIFDEFNSTALSLYFNGTYYSGNEIAVTLRYIKS